MTDVAYRYRRGIQLRPLDSRELPPQAGIGVYERDPDGLPATARVYDDEPPDERS